MNTIVEYTAAECLPDLTVVLRRETQGTAAPPRLTRLFDAAREQFDRLAEPRALYTTLTHEAFWDVYHGEGRNAADAPLHEIVPRAERLALFAATTGAPVANRIGALFKEGEPALGYALDVIASEATSQLADLVAERFRLELARRRETVEDSRVLPYSPGYCGWHISGQRRLFAALGPETIGIELTQSCLMRPLKSVSGVLVAARPAAHVFRPVFPFCEDCTTHECRGRMRAVLRPVR